MSGHVHFTEDVSFDPHAVRCELNDDQSQGSVDIGLLQVLHTYLVSFDMQHQLGQDLEIPPLQTPAISVTTLRKLDSGTGHHIVLEIKCGENDCLEEIITFENEAKQIFTLNLHAKLMPSHLGTPALKSGIKILHKAPDSASDAGSDWQGFQK